MARFARKGRHVAKYRIVPRFARFVSIWAAASLMIKRKKRLHPHRIIDDTVGSVRRVRHDICESNGDSIYTQRRGK
jgi:hypothetical protein